MTHCMIKKCRTKNVRVFCFWLLLLGLTGSAVPAHGGVLTHKVARSIGKLKHLFVTDTGKRKFLQKMQQTIVGTGFVFLVCTTTLTSCISPTEHATERVKQRSASSQSLQSPQTEAEELVDQFVLFVVDGENKGGVVTDFLASGKLRVETIGDHFANAHSMGTVDEINNEKFDIDLEHVLATVDEEMLEVIGRIAYIKDTDNLEILRAGVVVAPFNDGTFGVMLHGRVVYNNELERHLYLQGIFHRFVIVDGSDLLLESEF